MKSKYAYIALICMIMSNLLVGCNNKVSADLENDLKMKTAEIEKLNSSNTALNAEKMALENENAVLKAQLQRTDDSLINKALLIAQLLKDKDMAELSKHVHPVKGVRFSPYGYIDTDKHLNFTPEQIKGLPEDSQNYTWGSYDGTGDPIDMPFLEYYKTFIYDADFSNPQIIGNNAVIGKGNSLINIAEVYPGAAFVEFHFAGTNPEYEGMDWKSLRLIFEEYNGTRYLCAIVHDQWTI